MWCVPIACVQPGWSPIQIWPCPLLRCSDNLPTTGVPNMVHRWELQVNRTLIVHRPLKSKNELSDSRQSLYFRISPDQYETSNTWPSFCLKFKSAKLHQYVGAKLLNHMNFGHALFFMESEKDVCLSTCLQNKNSYISTSLKMFYCITVYDSDTI